MASSNLNSLSVFLLLLTSSILSTSTTSQENQHFTPTKLNVFCKNTPYPDACLDSLKLSISINISPTILTFLLQSIQSALSEAAKLTHLLYTGSSSITERQRGTLQDCKELHQITLSILQKSFSGIKSGDSAKLADARAYFSAALTNKNTCLEGLNTASGPSKPALVSSLISTYKHVSNSLSMLPKTAPVKHRRRRLMEFPRWVSKEDRRILQSDGVYQYDPSEVITVAQDGSGNFSTISDAIKFAPNNSYDKVIVYVKEGVYEEYVEIPSYKTNIILLGDGTDATFVTGNRSVADGWTTFRSATLAVSGEGFLARDLSIENSAGPEKHQAVALRINADQAALYRCSIDGFQDTLYVHSFRQFYRECDVSGTIDFIFGNAAVVFQACNIVSRMPMPGQFVAITAQSRDTPDEDTGMSIQNCSILATEELYSNSSTIRSYLGRPWREYSRTVLIESYIDDFIDPTGWTKWESDQGLETLYYGEYGNYGPGSGTDRRVNWTGFHLMEYDDAYNFTVSYFISGDEWLDSTFFPYDDGI